MIKEYLSKNKLTIRLTNNIDQIKNEHFFVKNVDKELLFVYTNVSKANIYLLN